MHGLNQQSNANITIMPKKITPLTPHPAHLLLVNVRLNRISLCCICLLDVAYLLLCGGTHSCEVMIHWFVLHHYMVLQHKDLDNWMDWFHKMFLRRTGHFRQRRARSRRSAQFRRHRVWSPHCDHRQFVNPESELDRSALPGIDCTGSCSLRQSKHFGCL